MNTKNLSFNYYLKTEEDFRLATDWSSRIYRRIKKEKGDFYMDMKSFLACQFLKNMDRIIKNAK